MLDVHIGGTDTVGPNGIETRLIASARELLPVIDRARKWGSSSAG